MSGRPEQPGASSNWSSRSLGSRFQHGIFYVLVRCRALWLARALLAVVVFYYALLPSVRRRCQPYVQRRFGRGSGWQNFVHAYRLYLNFGRVLLARMTASVTGHMPLAPQSHLRDMLPRILDRGKGCLVVSAHVGAWQLGLGALDSGGVPVHMLQWRHPGDVDRHYFERGQGKAVHVIDATRPVEALVQVTLALRQGHVVAIMGDRLIQAVDAPQDALREEPSVVVPFLGEDIRLPIRAFALASITGAPLLMVLTAWDKDGIHPALGEEIFVERGLNHRNPALFAPHARSFAQALERFTTQYPYQFFNFYNLWLEKK